MANIFDISVKSKYQYICDYRYFHHCLQESKISHRKLNTSGPIIQCKGMNQFIMQDFHGQLIYMKSMRSQMFRKNSPFRNDRSQNSKSKSIDAYETQYTTS